MRSMYIIRQLLFAVLISVFIVSCKEEITGKIGSCYYRSNDKVYYLIRQQSGKTDSIEMPNANALFFEIVYDELPGEECFNSNIWAKDKSNVWYKNLRLVGADPSTFSVLENGYSKDIRYAYYLNYPLSGAKAEEFETLGWFYAKTRTQLWYCGKEVSGIKHIASFRVIDSYFSSDTSQIYLFRDSNFVVVPGLNRAEFQCMDDQHTFRFTNLKWYKAGKSIYFFDSDAFNKSGEFLYQVPVSTDSFTILKEKYYSKDLLNVYYKDKIIEKADPNTFETLGNSYGKDSKTVYYQQYIIKDVDPNTFVCITDQEHIDAKAGNTSYYKGRKIK